MGSARAKNLALLKKWKWRWLQETNNLWAKVVSAANGGDPGTRRLGREPKRWSGLERHFQGWAGSRESRFCFFGYCQARGENG